MPESELSPLRSLLRRLTAALIGLSVLCLVGCASSRKATERFFAEQSGKAERRVESSELREARDSLREEPTNEARAETKLALPLQKNYHRRMNDEQKLIRTFVVERTD